MTAQSKSNDIKFELVPSKVKSIIKIDKKKPLSLIGIVVFLISCQLYLFIFETHVNEKKKVIIFASELTLNGQWRYDFQEI